MLRAACCRAWCNELLRTRRGQPLASPSETWGWFRHRRTSVLDKVSPYHLATLKLNGSIPKRTLKDRVLGKMSWNQWRPPTLFCAICYMLYAICAVCYAIHKTCAKKKEKYFSEETLPNRWVLQEPGFCLIAIFANSYSCNRNQSDVWSWRHNKCFRYEVKTNLLFGTIRKASDPQEARWQPKNERSEHPRRLLWFRSRWNLTCDLSHHKTSDNCLEVGAFLGRSVIFLLFFFLFCMRPGSL